MKPKSKNDRSVPNGKPPFRERMKIAFSLAANTARRTRLHPVLLLTAILLVILLASALLHFDLLLAKYERATTLFRDLILIAAATFAVPLALSRTLTAERALLNERYQSGAEMLGSEIPTVRLAAVFALQRLSMERSEDYHVDVVRLVCSFVRTHTRNRDKHRTADDRAANPPVENNAFEMGHSDDVRAALHFLGNRDNPQKNLERLHGLNRLDLSRCDLSGADLRNGEFRDTNFNEVNLENADLSGAKLSGCTLANANLTNANLSSATGLLQRELDKAVAKKGSPPRLGRNDQKPIDPDTNLKLVWRD